MKLNTTIFPLTLALAAMLAATGCYKSHPRVTQLPGTQALVNDQSGGPTIPNTQPIDTSNQNPNFNDKPPGSTPTAEIGDLSNYNQDRDALAAQTVYFAFDSAAVLSKEDDKLVIVSEKLKSDDSAKLLIEGNCDERGTDEYNRSLGERRALALREGLQKLGVDPMRVITKSYGKDKPVDTGHDESAWAKNRRGDFVVLHPKTGA
jgi:peptidoglycan-associated lipoprotein